ncbi:MAG TPA: hypothetical protein VLK24_08485 [Gaiellaceae bacterium]|nr:hypothetical protein [Gaiellaceae bacterium]
MTERETESPEPDDREQQPDGAGSWDDTDDEPVEEEGDRRAPKPAT